jgi:proteasome accessory factor B
MSEKVEAGARLFNLTCALLYTRDGLTRDEILSRVEGYSQEFKPYGDNTALIRKFERDKGDLKAAGIQLVAFNPPSAMEDNQEFYYKVPKQEFLWPSDLQLTSRQVAWLNLASSVWASASLSRDAANAALRIRGLGEVEDITELTGLAPRIRTHHSSFIGLSSAIEDGKEVTFSYRKPGATQVEQRIFRPWQLQNISGQWLVLGFDAQRKEPRSFLLRRIISRVTATSAEPKQVSGAELAAAQKSLNDFIASNLATLRVKPDTEAWFRFELDDVPHEKADEVSFNFMDAHLLADELRQYAGQIEVLRPAGLRELIEAGFEKVVEIHHG